LLSMGSTNGSPGTLEEQFRKMIEKGGPEGQYSTTFFKIMNHSVPANVASALAFQGPMLSPSSACSTSAQAMVLGWELIRSGLYDLVIAGGADELHYTSNAIFDVVQAASIGFNDRPSEAHLEKRGGRPLAEFVAGAYHCDGTHMSQPQTPAMVKVMTQSLKRAGLKAEDIGYLNAHATGTILGDAEGRKTPVSSLKGHFGHSLAACGAIEVISSIKMLDEQKIIGTRNFSERDAAMPAISLPRGVVDAKFSTFLSNNFAFGGINTSLIVSKVGTH
jgi:3-oxoacyl-[acyl-carrier-protein] synthase II